MIVWLWDASGPEYSGRGVTDGEDKAKRIVAAYLQSGTATVATLEAALLDVGIRTLADCYRRTGRGWHGRAGDSGVRWRRFTHNERAASLYLLLTASFSVPHVRIWQA